MYECIVDQVVTIWIQDVSGSVQILLTSNISIGISSLTLLTLTSDHPIRWVSGPPSTCIAVSQQKGTLYLHPEPED